MDMFGALALTTQPPEPSIIRQRPINNEEVIMNKVIWRQIYALSAWNILVMCLIIFFGEPMFNLYYTASTMTQDYKDTYTTEFGLVVPTVDGLMAIDKLQHLTIIFNTFVFLCFFNLINCRTVAIREYNVFSNFFNNWMFIFILLLIFVLQYVWSNYVFFLFNTYPISAKDFWTSFVWGSTSLAVAAMVKMSPEHWVEKMPVKIDENKPLGEDSQMMQLYND
jgi:Ca2+-transporting ATPase